jgi:hypothetical protein
MNIPSQRGLSPAASLSSCEEVEKVARDEASGEKLLRILDDELDTAATAERRGQKIYHSLRELSELIGGEYGDRVLYELVQNAHDAHAEGSPGDVAIRLVIHDDDRGELYVANGGAAFTLANVQAIRNVANSTKEVGEGIGNKGVGFRSVEALTQDPRIYSRAPNGAADRFDGFCFRFATPAEIEARMAGTRHADVASAVAQSMPRYLAAMPIDEQPEPVLEFARRGYATVVSLALRTAAAVKLAREQVQELARSEAPILLFLERVRRLEIDIEGVPGGKQRRTLTRAVDVTAECIAELEGCRIEVVTLGPERKRWVQVRRVVEPDRLRAAVERSIEEEPGLKRWLQWKGNAVVSVALPFDGRGLKSSRLFNFLPMGKESPAPLQAHLDAPFFTTIDRRRAKLDLPLNAELLDSACEACAAAALAISRRYAAISPRLVAELAAWLPTHLSRVQRAFGAVGIAWDAAEVWPTSGGAWANIRQVRAWPDGPFKVLSANRIASVAGAAILPPSLGSECVEAMRSLAARAGISIEPSDGDLATWAEAIAQRFSTDLDPADALWSGFYAELVTLMPKAERLRALSGRKIMLGRDTELVPAGTDMYVRPEGYKRGRSTEAPLPPKEIARKLSILSSQISVRPETFVAFERGGLWKRYDAVEILARLSGLFGDRPAPARRQAALVWAFEVWKHNTAAAKKALSTASLHVPARGGWTRASCCSFSESWTVVGKQLEAFLAEAGPLSTGCRTARERLLLGWEEWPVSDSNSKADWIRFLMDAGVVDGLRPMASGLPKGAHRGDSWGWRLGTASGTALDQSWRDNHNLRRVAHPYTDYSVGGHAWFLPGQEVVDRISDDARKRFSALVIQHLQTYGSGCLTFSMGRFDRPEPYQDRQSVRTPLSTFLMTAPWFPIQGRGEERFVRVGEAWLFTDRRNDPKFVARAPDEIGDVLSAGTKVFEILTKPPYGLRVWKEPATAAARLGALADLCADLEQHERSVFRKQYDQAWQDLGASGGRLEANVRVAVEGATGFSAVSGGGPLPVIYVRTSRDREMAKLLIDTGALVLASTGDGDAAIVVTALNDTRAFDVRRTDEGDVRLLVDGESFQTSLRCPLLADVVPWLAEALVLGHEMGARDLEKGLQAATLEERFRRIRLRVCTVIELRSAEGVVKPLERYVYRDDDRPTLIVTGALDRQQLADSAAQLSLLIHANLRSFEPLLLRLYNRLAAEQPLRELGPPLDVDYAFALQLDLEIVREHLAERRNDRGLKLFLIAPVVAYFAGAEFARTVEQRLVGAASLRWADLLLEHVPRATVEALWNILDATDDLAVLRRELGLEYARFNRALQELGRVPLSSEAELRRLFALWKDELAPDLRERLRRHYVASTTDSVALQEYADQRTLDFITFDERWIETHESIDRQDVQRRAVGIFDVQFGADPGGRLPELESVRASNRRALAAFAQTALPVLRAAAREGLPDPWLSGAAEVAAAADRTGALDFALLEEEEMIGVLLRAGLWPRNLPQTLELGDLGLSEEDLNAHERRLAEQRAEEARKRNSIQFAGRAFDTTATDFAPGFAGFAEKLFAGANWRARSKLRTLNLQEISPGEPGHGGGGAGHGCRASRLPESIRAALGLAGELLAFQYLRTKHSGRFAVNCWVSENRRALFPELGDDSLGFDFRVNTAETEWLYEVKATSGDACEFELTDNEYRTAVAAKSDKTRRYRILVVQHTLDVERCRVLELPNPVAPASESRYRIIGRSSVRMKFALE